MATYLFIAKPEYNPELVNKTEGANWSCGKKTKPGDTALVYVTGKGICLEWRLVSKPKENARWGYACRVKLVRRIEPPISFPELREKIQWKPIELRFRGYNTLSIPDEVLRQLAKLRRNITTVFQPEDDSFEKDLRKSLNLTAKERRERLAKAKIKPLKRKSTATVFQRNPDVVAEVLARAKGRCESCKKPAPFKRVSDGSPYLEVHHLIRLIDGGDDSVANATALCPNCHRRMHFGQ
ncbi:HNH endonuclease [Turneriella parva]|uniref:HNH endonuclease n=1 Tax=Turneriella parva (strain ATCC BAA-1111 / DSM 21527 / NCTC 11395 / H) TaxID=869212 RepID=I4B9I8_TURPD|nr:HNH endonuclease [Turneriella parva]AFM13945.1 HNH endonuclease [Turneriella parva DSM 21527]